MVRPKVVSRVLWCHCLWFHKNSRMEEEKAAEKKKKIKEEEARKREKDREMTRSSRPFSI